LSNKIIQKTKIGTPFVEESMPLNVKLMTLPFYAAFKNRMSGNERVETGRKR
jgi:hypothetical protein